MIHFLINFSPPGIMLTLLCQTNEKGNFSWEGECPNKGVASPWHNITRVMVLNSPCKFNRNTIQLSHTIPSKSHISLVEIHWTSFRLITDVLLFEMVDDTLNNIFLPGAKLAPPGKIFYGPNSKWPPYPMWNCIKWLYLI